MKAVRIEMVGMLLLAVIGLSVSAAAQEIQVAPGSERPIFTRFPGKLRSPKNTIEAATTPLQTWNGSFSYQGTTYNYNMVGTAPSTGASTTVQVEIIPLKIVIAGKGRNGGATYDPAKVLSNGNSVITNTAHPASAATKRLLQIAKKL